MRLLLLCLLMLALPARAMDHLPWTRQATIYEVNLRQYTPEGTIKAFTPQLPRLKKMGIDIIWLMPLHPIGKVERKGTLGSYYAVADYTALDPAYGSMDDLRALVRSAHKLGMHVIIDWVANHTAWDNPWVKAHPDWYKKNAKGEIYPVTFTDGPEPEYWTDVTALDYNQPGLRTAMISAMAHWVKEADIDGFRCDVAGLVPTDFWNEARQQLDAIKPMFMLAEWSEPALHDKAFDMTYGWDLADTMKAIAKGKATADALRKLASVPPKVFPADAYRMRFTNNHDFNSWQGSDAELYGPAYKAMAVLAATWPGMPLVYSGQEAGLDKRLAFFEKDPIDWKDYPLQGFYRELLTLKHKHPALANGQYGAPMEVLDVGVPEVFAFRRQQGKDMVTVAVNLSAQPHTAQVAGKARALPAWGYWFSASHH